MHEFYSSGYAKSRNPSCRFLRSSCIATSFLSTLVPSRARPGRRNGTKLGALLKHFRSSAQAIRKIYPPHAADVRRRKRSHSGVEVPGMFLGRVPHTDWREIGFQDLSVTPLESGLAGGCKYGRAKLCSDLFYRGGTEGDCGRAAGEDDLDFSYANKSKNSFEIAGFVV